jgi:soluble lytic murein transglycosylase
LDKFSFFLRLSVNQRISKNYHHGSNSVLLRIKIMMFALLTCASISLLAAPKSEQKEDYFKVRQAIRTQKEEAYLPLLNSMKDHPLYPYLFYQHNMRRLRQMDVASYQSFSKKIRTTPLFLMARHHYLNYLGQYRMWKEFLEVSPNEPQNPHLKCYYFRAHIQTGKQSVAWKGAEKMWMTPHSQKDQCDILFDEWKKANKRTDQHIWQRMLLAYGVSRLNFMTYLSNMLESPTYQKNAKRLLEVYKKPEILKTMTFDSTGEINERLNQDIIYHGIRKLAYKNMDAAIEIKNKKTREQKISNYQVQVLERFFIRRILYDQRLEQRPIADAYLTKTPNDALIESRIRWAISEKNWADVELWLNNLSSAMQKDDRWQYWRARLLKKKKKYTEADAIFLSLTEKRSFYGFACAEHLNQEFPLNKEPISIDSSKQEAIKNNQATQRIHALFDMGFETEARMEWLYLLKHSSSDEKKQLAVYSQRQNWHNLSIEASIHGQLWDALDIRFPNAWSEHFEHFAKKNQVPISDLQAIARRESAFNVYARSPVGARGLMQIMPATAKEIARRLGIQYKGSKQLHDPEVNVQFGSAYYFQLLKKFDENRIFALASYNAGPGRVKQWRKKSDGALDMMSFIETIPYRETREYVQAVLIYRVIYQVFNGDKPQMFTSKELSRLY